MNTEMLILKQFTELDISLKTEVKQKNHKLWRRLFANIAFVFTLITALVILANGALLDNYFEWREKKILFNCAKTVTETSLDDKESAALIFQQLENNNNVTLVISRFDSVIYSTVRRVNFGYQSGMTGFDMLFGRFGHSDYISGQEEYRNGYIYNLHRPDYNMSYMVYALDYGDGYTVEVLIERTLIEQSAKIAGEFVMFIAAIGLFIALIWSVVFSQKFAKPISDMNKKAVKMAKLDFSNKLDVEFDDEIGQLAGSINELSVSLDKALSELNEKNERLQDEIELERRIDSMRKGFVANVSHELKTPISIIKGYAEALDGKLAENPEKRKKYCGIIRDETERMNHMVVELLELSRLEGGLLPDYKVYDISEAAKHIADIFSDSAEKKQVKIKIHTPSSAMVSADEILIGNALQNLVSNAISHVNEKGEIRIKVAKSPADNEKIRVSVFNSGSMVDPENMEKIWVSFWRADKAHNRSEGRFGLGLSIVKAIMVAHSNNFGVYNISDGVCFWIELDKAFADPIPQLPEKLAVNNPDGQ